MPPILRSAKPPYPQKDTQSTRFLHFPDTPRDTYVEICVPSPLATESFEPYRPPIPRPPKSFFSNSSLTDVVDFVKDAKKQRNISPRFLAFLNYQSEKCEEARLTSSKKARAAKIMDIRQNQDMIESRWDNVHGADGLGRALVEQMQALDEIRLLANYGDYLSIACSKIKTARLESEEDWVPFHINGKHMDWSDIDTALLKEEHRDETADPTHPFRAEVEKAAEALHQSYDQVRWEIHNYAKRNSVCHSGVKKMIDECNWADLAQQLNKDRRTLMRPYIQGIDIPRMKAVISGIQNEWFIFIASDGEFLENEVATEKKKRRLKKKYNVASNPTVGFAET